MFKIISSLLILFPSVLFSQTLKRIENKETKEIYFVLKSDKSVKHGEYRKYTNLGQLLCKGYFKNGKKDSIWEAYTPEGKLEIKFNFATQELFNLEAEESDKSRKFKVIVDSLSFDTTLSRVPLFLGGRNFIYHVLGRNLIYPKKAREAGIQGKIIVKFIIDKYGNTRNYQVEKPIGYLLDEEAIRVLQLLPELWLPGELNGQAVDVEFVFPLRFEVN